MRSLNQPARRTLSSLAVVVMCAAPAITSSAQPARSQGNGAAAQSPAGGATANGKCDVGQVHKWSGRGWVCANDLVGGASGGGAGPHILDANNDTVGAAFGTALADDTTIPRLLFTMGDSPKPFLLAVDEGGFVADGQLFVQTTNELMTCATSCGGTIGDCMPSCLTATNACAASNAWLAPPAKASSLFRTGAVVGQSPATAELWAATSATLAPIGECVTAGIPFPVCLTAVYHPADDSCTFTMSIGDDRQKMAYPAIPLVNLHALHPPPYSLRQQ
jgi:hypothetical protein